MEDLSIVVDEKLFAVPCPDKFAFPFEPYEVQANFMRKLFDTIEKKKIGIFESPTGTGKSLSIICGALAWLKGYKDVMRTELDKIKEKEQSTIKPAKVDDWLEADFRTTKVQNTLRERRMKVEAVVKREEQWTKRRQERAKERQNAFSTKDELASAVENIDKVLKESKMGIFSDGPDADLLPDEYESEDETHGKLGQENSNDPTEQVIKIIYCTRTHSQVTQFIRELKKSPFGSSTRATALASRQNLCVFDPVRKLKSARFINDRCIELQKGKSVKTKEEGRVNKRQKKDPGKESKCPYYEKDAIGKLSDELLVVVIPYNLVLHRSTREASGINLRGNIVIVDEAHNLIEAITSMYSAELDQRQVQMALWQVQEYHNRYQKRLTPNNLLRIRNLLHVLSKVVAVCKTEAEDLKTVDSSVWTVDEFKVAANLEAINLFKVLGYCRKSLLSKKLISYAARYADSFASGSGAPAFEQDVTGSSPLMNIESFLETLTNSSKDGRVTRSQDANGNTRLKFLLLNPAVYVKDIFRDARSVIFAGGTMQPFSDFENQLLALADVPSARISHFSCGHVIPPRNILPIALGNGPNGKPLSFTFQNRKDEEMILQLGRTIQNICNIVPGGVVCFFPSYDFADSVMRIFEKTPSFLDALEKRKKVFREPKKTQDVEATLKTYANTIEHSAGVRTGAIMFAVVGGKLSEGINFSDDLARCVLMVGLPFPNASSLELKEKMTFLDANLPKAPDGRPPSKPYYENLCMKAVNQSIGRAIRHAGDYAAIVLIDARYSSPRISSGLSGWIGSQLQTPTNFAGAFGSIRQFFVDKRAL